MALRAHGIAGLSVRPVPGLTRAVATPTPCRSGRLVCSPPAATCRPGWPSPIATRRPRRRRWQAASTRRCTSTTYQALHTALSNSVADRWVWRPDAFGSICFLVSGAIAYRISARHGWRPVRGGPGWWEPAVNLLGCIFFGIAAVAALRRAGDGLAGRPGRRRTSTPPPGRRASSRARWPRCSPAGRRSRPACAACASSSTPSCATSSAWLNRRFRRSGRCGRSRGLLCSDDAPPRRHRRDRHRLTRRWTRRARRLRRQSAVKSTATRRRRPTGSTRRTRRCRASTASRSPSATRSSTRSSPTASPRRSTSPTCA